MYYIVYGIFYLLSLLPWRIIYIISDFAAFLLYRVFKYRKPVVMNNLLIAFPEKTETEREKIAKEFYSNFTDNFIEVIKLLSISKKELNKRFQCNYEVMNDLYDSGINIQLLLSHQFNWEIANPAYAANLQYPFVVVYMGIANETFKKLFYKIRSRYGSLLVGAWQFRKDFAPISKDRFVLALVGDQSPVDACYWLPFFGKLTAFVKGPEKTARMYKTAIVMGNCYKLKRGHYKTELTLLTTDPNSLPHGEITKKMAAFMEDSIRQHPSNYLWSHRRWKREYNEEHHQKDLLV
ncbi:lysophospholipid acyltransferase family protein [Ferruginibacter albus]|uniref:lysophospholipid acyltransferase family protein n=1 Tax=Ferruginibacter albus TaxID=2875540 RepID=UPI001CC80F47|nr:lipid A biosynthesis acyltransferase [Ferruginibacter albus]UAY51778.1 lipid A biosynthesis acyltransferase [Ferruginibacter albus]